MAFWSWSKTADTNQTADPTINWAEGQLPSTVNNSARAMMARAAEWRDDISGTITTGGTSSAYTITSNQVFDTLAHLNGAMICFVPHVTNAADATLNVDGLGAKPLRWAPSQNVQSGLLIAGTPYAVTYFSATNEFILRGMGGNPYGVPVACGLEFWGITSPGSAFAFPYGQAISRTAYAGLFALIGTTYGSGDGSTTFNLPDKRGRLSAPLDNLGGSTPAGRLDSIASTTIGTPGGSQTGQITATYLPISSPWSVSATTNVTTDSAGSHSHTASGWSSGNQSESHAHFLSISIRNLSNSAAGSDYAVYSPSGIGTQISTGDQTANHFHGAIGGTTDAVAGHTHTASATTSVTVGSNGSGGNAFNKLPPLIVCNYIMRVI